MTVPYAKGYQNQTFAREVLQSGSPIIRIARTGPDLAPLEEIHRANDGQPPRDTY